MDITSGNIILIGSILLLISIFAGKTSSRFGVPALIFFLSIGILAGSEGLGGIYFNNPVLAQFIGITALNFILFSGGLDTNWSTVKPVLKKGITLSTLGVILTAFSIGLFTHLVLDFTLIEGLLLGSIVSSTDAAAVFSILRNKGIGLKGSLRPTLELESGSNDPMAYFLTITFTTLAINGNENIVALIPQLLQQFIMGATVGYFMGKGSRWIINRIKLDYDGLYAVLIMALAMFTFSLTDVLGGNGFLAIYLSAMVLGNSNFIHRRSMMRFFEGIAWLMQIILFLTLGLLVYPSHVWQVAGYGLLIAAFLIFVARPLGVFVSLAFFKTNIRSKLFISWVGLRGAVPIVFATYPLIAGLQKSDMIFNLVFFISVTSVILQGTTLSRVAKLLGVALPATVKRRDFHGTEYFEKVKTEYTEIAVPDTSSIVGKRIVDLNIPYSVTIMAIKRDGHYIHPTGSTMIAGHDVLFILADDYQSLNSLFASLHHKK
ncbi:MAG: potassium/proton antiporter [Chitinophagaceae bacterium]